MIWLLLLLIQQASKWWQLMLPSNLLQMAKVEVATSLISDCVAMAKSGEKSVIEKQLKWQSYSQMAKCSTTQQVVTLMQIAPVTGLEQQLYFSDPRLCRNGEIRREEKDRVTIEVIARVIRNGEVFHNTTSCYIDANCTSRWCQTATLFLWSQTVLHWQNQMRREGSRHNWSDGVIRKWRSAQLHNNLWRWCKMHQLLVSNSNFMSRISDSVALAKSDEKDRETIGVMELFANGEVLNFTTICYVGAKCTTC